MAMECDNQLCNKCFISEKCDEQYDGTPPCAKAVVENCHSLQLLKREIATIIPLFRTKFVVGDSSGFHDLCERLLQLSRD